MGKFKEENGKTRIGMFLKKTAPHLLDVVGDIIPDAGVLGIIKNVILYDKTISQDDKDEALELLKMDLEDIKSARLMYQETRHVMADDIAKRVIKWNLVGVAIAIIVEVGSVMVIDDKVLIAIISGAIGGVTTALLQERQQIINFFFGSSRGSKEKDFR